MPQKEHIRSWAWPTLALICLWLIHVSANFLWLQKDTRPPFYDTAGNAVVAIRVARLPYITDPLQSMREVAAIGPYPPLTHLVSVPLMYLRTPDIDTSVLAEIIFLAVLIFSVYWIGMELDSTHAGLLSALIVSMYPIIYGLSRHLLLDVPLTAVTAAALAAMLWSNYFVNRRRSILVGVCFGLGMLTKWTFMVFVAGPVAVVLVMLLVQRKAASLKNFLLAVGIGLLLSAPWYVMHGRTLLTFLQIGGWHAAKLEGDPSIWSQASWMYYIVQLVNQQILLPFFLLFLLGVFLMIKNHGIDLATCLLFAWIVIPYIVFTLFANKDIRYTMPYLPAIALITGIGIAQIRSRMLFWAFVLFILIISVPQFMTLTIGSVPGISQEHVPQVISGRVGDLPWTIYTEHVHIASPPREEDWQVTAIVDRIVEDSAAPSELGDAVQVLVLPNAPFFEPQGFIYSSQLIDAPVVITSVTGILETDENAILNNADYIVTKTGNLGPSWTLQAAEELSAQLMPDGDLTDRYAVIGEYMLPDGSTAQLLRRKSVENGS